MMELPDSMLSDNLMNLKCVRYNKAVIREEGYRSMLPNIDFFRMCTFEIFNHMFGPHEGAVRTPPAQRRRLDELCFQ